jgi:adenylate kinase
VTQATRTGPQPAAGLVPRLFVMLGAPGAGKGTQAGRLAAGLGLLHISTGDLFRSALRDGSRLGDEVRRYVEKGQLVPDALTVQVLTDRLGQPDALAGAILDGFPRTRAQAEALDALLLRRGGAVAAALYIEVAPDELVRRLSGRRVCSDPHQHVYNLISRPPRVAGVCDVDGTPLEQRPDDRPETIRARLERQQAPMFDVVDHYADAGVLHAVRGERDVDEITDDLLRLALKAERRG